MYDFSLVSISIHASELRIPKKFTCPNKKHKGSVSPLAFFNREARWWVEI